MLRPHNIFIYTISWALSAAMFFRHTLLSGGDALPGDRGDTRLLIVICEHWFRVITGRDPWLSPNFFHPVEGVLGYSDALLLYAPPYATFRLIGVDMFSAFQLTLTVVHIIGFAGTVVLLRRCIGLPSWVCAVGGVLFLSLNGAYVAASHSHSQLLSIWFIPILGIAMAAYVKATDPRQWQGWLAGSVFASFFSVLCYTSFYTGWFFFLFGMVSCAIGASGFIALSGGRHALVSTISFLRSRMLQLGFFVVIGLVSFLPFWLTYLPVKAGGAVRLFTEVQLPTLIDLINVGSGNFLWGAPFEKLFKSLEMRPGGHELKLGMPLILTALFLATVIINLVRLCRSGKRRNLLLQVIPEKQSYLAVTLGVGVVLCWLLAVQFEGISLWWWVYQLVPGADAIRAVGRFNLVLALPVIIVAMIGLAQLWDFRRKVYQAKYHIGPAVIMVFLCLGLAAEQINTQEFSFLSKSEELTRLRQVSPAPHGAQAFFLGELLDTEEPSWALQIDAMLIAQYHDIPTIHGYSGLSPPGWQLSDLRDSHYVATVRQWLIRHGLEHGIYALDPITGTWDNVASIDQLVPKVELGKEIHFDTNGEGYQYAVTGWSAPGSWGMWSEAPESRLVIPLNPENNQDLILSVLATAFVNEVHREQNIDVVVNGKLLKRWSFRYGQPGSDRTVEIPSALLNGTPELRITFKILNALSPKSLNLWNDSRELGIELIKIKVFAKTSN